MVRARNKTTREKGDKTTFRRRRRRRRKRGT
jgi:hypothetical protein